MLLIQTRIETKLFAPLAPLAYNIRHTYGNEPAQASIFAAKRDSHPFHLSTSLSIVPFASRRRGSRLHCYSCS